MTDDEDAEALLRRAELLRQAAKTVTDAKMVEALEQAAAELNAKAEALLKSPRKRPEDKT